MYLLKLNRKGDVYKDDDGITGVPEFLNVLNADKLGADALKWVALVCDYDSPYRHFNEKERFKAVSKDTYGTYEWRGASRPEVQAALEKYKKLQFDPLDEQLRAFNVKIDQFTLFMNNMRAIERRGQRQKIQGDKGLSFLENKKEQLEETK